MCFLEPKLREEVIKHGASGHSDMGLSSRLIHPCQTPVSRLFLASFWTLIGSLVPCVTCVGVASCPLPCFCGLYDGSYGSQSPSQSQEGVLESVGRLVIAEARINGYQPRIDSGSLFERPVTPTRNNIVTFIVLVSSSVGVPASQTKQRHLVAVATVSLQQQSLTGMGTAKPVALSWFGVSCSNLSAKKRIRCRKQSINLTVSYFKTTVSDNNCCYNGYMYMNC